MENLLEKALCDRMAQDAVIAQSERERDQLMLLREEVSEAELAAGGSVKHDIGANRRYPRDRGCFRGFGAYTFSGLPSNIFSHLGDGNLHVNIRPPVGRTVAELGALYEVITLAVEEIAMERGGSFSAEHGVGQLRIASLQR